ncbi:hypothetical protein AVEN_12222-1 [Araneus ventricosus]|uniref:Uncharacterized protein n=1 Tax=Araneus ventricosus TaxID=182803 RepID=A0A4Y2HY06_ARAVE|nr:hypothetical protein AVEN_12222-1 [Araneus ventricosus]
MGLSWDRNFKPQSNVGEPSSPKFPTTPNGRCLTRGVKFNLDLSRYKADLLWNRVSKLKPSGPKLRRYHETTAALANSLKT